MTAKLETVAAKLAAGPTRGLGCANAIAIEAQHSSQTLGELVAALEDERIVVTIRAANALKKVQKSKPGELTKHASRILHIALDCEDLRTRWNLVTVVGQLPLKGTDRSLAVELMFEAFRSESGFLRTFAMTALVQFAADDASLKKRVLPIVQQALDDPSAAVRARARKLWPKGR